MQHNANRSSRRRGRNKSHDVKIGPRVKHRRGRNKNRSGFDGNVVDVGPASRGGYSRF